MGKSPKATLETFAWGFWSGFYEIENWLPDGHPQGYLYYGFAHAYNGRPLRLAKLRVNRYANPNETLRLVSFQLYTGPLVPHGYTADYSSATHHSGIWSNVAVTWLPYFADFGPSVDPNVPAALMLGDFGSDWGNDAFYSDKTCSYSPTSFSTYCYQQYNPLMTNGNIEPGTIRGDTMADVRSPSTMHVPLPLLTQLVRIDRSCICLQTRTRHCGIRSAVTANLPIISPTNISGWANHVADHTCQLLATQVM